MWCRATTRAFFAFLVFAFFWVDFSSATIRYELSVAKRSEHLFQVAVTVPDVHGELTLQMPAWNALYEIRDFSSRIAKVEAFSGTQPLAAGKIDKLTWRIRGDGTITVRYAIYWDTAGPFASQLNEEHAFINPAMVFMYSPNRRTEPISLKLRDMPTGWQVASALLTSLERENRTDSNTIIAPNYDALVDGPVEIAAFNFFRISGIDPPIDVAIHGDGWKQSDVETSLRKICKYEIEMMGGAPFDHYLFIFHIGKAAQGAGGGMEHANSTAINIGSEAQLASVSAHEFFHLWNVKRIRPASLEPIDYTREQYSRALWFAEGVTSTYGNYALVRSGIWNRQSFYADLSGQINELEARPANHWQSAEQSSIDTWLDKYDYYNGPDFSVSYYTKGQVLGVLLDILIRDRTGNAHSLDDVLRKMNDDFAKHEKPYRDSLDVRLTAEQIAGGSFEEFFGKYIAGAEPLPYDATFAKAGLLLRKQEIQRAQLGFSLSRDPSGRWIVRDVTSGAAVRAGLQAGDEIVNFNNDSVPRRPEMWLQDKKPGELLKLHITRGEKTSEIQFPLGATSATVFTITEDPSATASAKEIRDGILRGKTSTRSAAQ